MAAAVAAIDVPILTATRTSSSSRSWPTIPRARPPVVQASATTERSYRTESQALAIGIGLLALGVQRVPFQGWRESHRSKRVVSLKAIPADAAEKGLAKEVLVSSNNPQACPQKGEKVRIHYKGMLKDGSVFDSSWTRGQAYEFVLGKDQSIEGLEVLLSTMAVGEQAKLTVPADMAYGEQGVLGLIPPGADLTFEVELLRIGEPQAVVEPPAPAATEEPPAKEEPPPADEEPPGTSASPSDTEPPVTEGVSVEAEIIGSASKEEAAAFGDADEGLPFAFTGVRSSKKARKRRRSAPSPATPETEEVMDVLAVEAESKRTPVAEEAEASPNPQPEQSESSNEQEIASEEVLGSMTLQELGSGAELCLRVPLPEALCVPDLRSVLNVEARTKWLKVELSGQTLINAELFAETDMDMNYWDLDVDGPEKVLVIYLAKIDTQKRWQALFSATMQAPKASVAAEATGPAATAAEAPNPSVDEDRMIQAVDELIAEANNHLKMLQVEKAMGK